jgi:hypothetical protein
MGKRDDFVRLVQMIATVEQHGLQSVKRVAEAMKVPEEAIPSADLFEAALGFYEWQLGFKFRNPHKVVDSSEGKPAWLKEHEENVRSREEACRLVCAREGDEWGGVEHANWLMLATSSVELPMSDAVWKFWREVRRAAEFEIHLTKKVADEALAWMRSVPGYSEAFVFWEPVGEKAAPQ